MRVMLQVSFCFLCTITFLSPMSPVFLSSQSTFTHEGSLGLYLNLFSGAFMSGTFSILSLRLGGLDGLNITCVNE